MTELSQVPIWPIVIETLFSPSVLLLIATEIVGDMLLLLLVPHAFLFLNYCWLFFQKNLGKILSEKSEIIIIISLQLSWMIWSVDSGTTTLGGLLCWICAISPPWQPNRLTRKPVSLICYTTPYIYFYTTGGQMAYFSLCFFLFPPSSTPLKCYFFRGVWEQIAHTYK